MSLEQLVASYGYVAVLLGGMVEGETVVLLGGLAAHRGYLDVARVIAAAAFGTVLATQLWFQLGRRRGAAWLARFPRWEERSQRVLERARRHRVGVILGYRFLYGVRTVTPFALGMSGISPWQFALLDTLATVLWASLIAGAGFALGGVAQRVLGELERHERALFVAVAGVGALLWLAAVARGRRRGGG